MFKIGDSVRVVGIPEALPADNEVSGLMTTSLFQRCIGRVFPIAAINELGYAELEVGEVDGLESYAISIWIEPDLLSTEDA